IIRQGVHRINPTSQNVELEQLVRNSAAVRTVTPGRTDVQTYMLEGDLVTGGSAGARTDNPVLSFSAITRNGFTVSMVRQGIGGTVEPSSWTAEIRDGTGTTVNSASGSWSRPEFTIGGLMPGTTYTVVVITSGGTSNGGAVEAQSTAG
ncbi:MAG: hypothetical protein OXE50_02270, partial [Chloroflexi bacterium]|nr:hypothetical protein [Chloroflexota bacterium]